MDAAKRSEFAIYLFAMLLSAVFMSADLLLPLGVAAGVPYVCVVLLGWWLPRRRFIFWLAGFSSLLVIAGYLVSSEGGIPWMVAANRLLALFAIWVTATLLWLAKKGDEIRRDRESLLSAIMDTAADAIITINEHGIILSFNDSAEKMFKYPSFEVIGQNMSMLMPEPDAGNHDGHLARYMRTRDSHILGVAREMAGLRKDGKEFSMDISVSEARADGRPTFTWIGRDITDRKRAERIIHQSEARLAKAQEIAGIGSFERNLLTNELTWSDETYRLCGLEPRESEMSVEKFMSILHPDDRELFNKSSHELIQNNEPYRICYRIVLPDGEERIFQTEGAVVHDEAGKQIRVVGTVQDVTEQKRAGEALSRQALEARLLHRAAEVATEADSVEKALQQVVGLVCGLTGWPVGHVYMPSAGKGKALESASIWHLDDPETYAIFREATEKTGFEIGEGLPGRILESGEPAWVADVQADPGFLRNRLATNLGVRGAFGFPVKVLDEIVAVLEFFANQEMSPDENLLRIMRNVGIQLGRVFERKRAEEERERNIGRLTRLNSELYGAKNALERNIDELASRNKELDEFTYFASHDLQEPLRKITSFGDLLKEDLGDNLPGEAEKDLDFMIDGAVRMRNLIQDLLKLSRAGKSKIQRENFDLNKCADSALENLSVGIGESGAVITRDDMPEVWGDPALLAQVYQNLIGNALKFLGAHSPLIRLTAETEDGLHVFGVQDNGIGMDPKYAGKIFEPFKRLHGLSQYEGSRIGLAIAQKIVTLHGGRIWAESEPGAGSHFKFILGSNNMTDNRQYALKGSSSEQHGNNE